MHRNDPLDKIVTYIEKLAQPGMKVVFLVQWNSDSFGVLKDAQIGEPPSETASPAVGTAKAIDPQQQRVLEEKILSASRALQRTGAEIDVDVYTGSLAETMARYKGDGGGYILIL
jgi:hypothetical protein